MLNNFSILYSNGVSIKSVFLLTLVIDLILIFLLNTFTYPQKEPHPTDLKTGDRVTALNLF